MKKKQMTTIVIMKISYLALICRTPVYFKLKMLKKRFLELEVDILADYCELWVD